MKKNALLLALAPLALVACVNPGTNDPGPQEAAATSQPEAVEAPMHGWPESNG